MERKLIYVGYRDFEGKKNQHYYVVDCITEPTISRDGSKAFVSNVALFLTKDKYFDFIKSTELLSVINATVEIVGDKVRYSI